MRNYKTIRREHLINVNVVIYYLCKEKQIHAAITVYFLVVIAQELEIEIDTYDVLRFLNTSSISCRHHPLPRR